MALLISFHSSVLIFAFFPSIDLLKYQPLMAMINDDRPKLNKYLYLLDRRVKTPPVNSTLRKHSDLHNHQRHVPLFKELSRKRRQSNFEFKNESLKYFTCARVSRPL